MKHVLLVLLLFGFLGGTGQNLNNILPDTIEHGFYETVYGGMLISGYFKDYQRDGNWITRFPNGQLHILEQYNTGNKEGLYLKINRRGDLLEQFSFKAGQLHGQKLEFASTGKIKSEEHYKNGQFDGLKKVFYDKGPV